MNNKTVLGLSKTDKIILIIIPPILGVLLGWFIVIISGWLIKVPFIPLKEILEWISTLSGIWVSIIGAVIGGIVGIIFTLYAFHESLKITVSNSDVKLEIKEKAETIAKKDISAIFMEQKYVIILGNNGVELYRGQTDSKREYVEDTFEHYGFPWVDKDPFENQYLRWVTDYPEFPSHVNALLSARERALENNESEEAKILRNDLARSGVVIRDENKHQYVRIVRRDDK